MNQVNPRVVVAIKDKQPTALRFAVEESRRLGVKLRVVHATGAKRGHEAVAVLDAARHFIDQELPRPQQLEFRLVEETPLAALTRETTCSLMVLGTDQARWPKRLRGGAVASRIVDRAECPVVVVPEVAYPRERRGGVLITTDSGSIPSAPLRFAFDEARHRSTHVIAQRVLPVSASREDDEWAREKLDRLLVCWRASHPGVRVVTTVVNAEPVAASVHASHHAELIVVGRPRWREASFSWRRSLVDALIRDAASPIAVVPDPHGGDR